ncbi:hypothetical protein A3C37_04170 [Candidatus Peribacteria bacterium RIFCSPHIGHO2_02_FULL_53_20]|nr:MAG: hypothetical protein A3C37_04170 [Candidatus Peribacteria bacterium RIFCSPHIGHO2_02_FULL_53_20]OGJ67546.1 MAG: hypothetical protein A3B61_04375 [Candidatus Peribacteria bacterium RIFCSPLOWO2_01_FULL_53_10]
MITPSAKKLFSCACIALLSTLAACGSTDGDDRAAEGNTAEGNTEEGANFNIDVDTDARVHIVTSAGSFNGGNTIPKNWPSDVPAYPGAQVVYSAAVTTPEGDDGLALTLSTNDTLEQAVEFYKGTLAAEGWKILSTLESGEATIIGAEKGNRVFAASISNAGGQTMISLGMGKK